MDAWMLFWQQLPQQLVNSLWLGGVYALFALGYTLVFGVIKELNLAHGGIFMWGAFIGLLCVTYLKVPVFLAMAVAMAGAGICGILLERLAYKPLRQLSTGSAILWAGFLLFLFANFRLFPSIVNKIIGGCGIIVMLISLIQDFRGKFPGTPRERDELAPLISSIGAGSILVSLSQATFGAQQSRFPVDTFPHKVFQWGPVSVTLLQLVIFILSLMLMAGLSWFVFRSKTGRGLRAVACNPKVASLLGVHVDKIYLQTFFFSSALAGAAGVLHGLAFNAITPYMGAPVQLKGLTVIVLGGMGNIAGAVIGGFIVAILEVFSVATGQSNFRDAIVFLLLFMILLIRPRGLLGGKGIDKV
jgi:branched-chain amino acid transport system permease protein